MMKPTLPSSPSYPAGNRMVAPPGERRSYARAVNADKAMSVCPRQGKLIVGKARGKQGGLRNRPSDRPRAAYGPPWLLAYVLLNGRAHSLNECFQLSIRELDGASGPLIHFQDIGSPRVRGEVFERIAAPELLSRAELDDDLYQQEISRHGTEWNHRLIETERLAHALGTDMEDLPGIAFRTTPFDGDAVLLKIRPDWYATESTRWRFIELLKEWLETRTGWLKYSTPPTTKALNDRLCQELADLEQRIDAGIKTSLSQRAVVSPFVDENTFCAEHGVRTMTFAGETVRVPDRKGFRYIAILLRQPGKPVAAITLRNVVGAGPHETMGGLAPDPDVGVKRTRVCPGGHGPPAPHTIDVDDRIDPIARNEYRRRIEELEEEVQFAVKQNDAMRQAELTAERDAINKELRATTNHKGKSRKFSTEEERARRSVVEAVRAALKVLSEIHPSLHSHLESSLTTGSHLVYRPAESFIWITT